MMLTLAFVLGLSAVSFAAEVPDIRVQLSANSNTAQVEVVEGEYLVLDSTTGMPLGRAKAGDECTIHKEGLNLELSGFTKCNKGSQSSQVYFYPLDRKKQCLLSFKNIEYVGIISFSNTDNGLVVVNSLPVEDYLYGVVGQEMGYGAPLEALKTQAVVSRSFALKKMGTGLYSDITSGSQVYRGYNAQQVSGFNKVKHAVDATSGEVVCYQDAIIDAVFHSNSGGFTEASENIWQACVPYLRAVNSPEDEYALRYAYQDANGWPGNSYEWSVTLTREQLEECIAAWNSAHPNDVINIGEVKDINLSRVDDSTGEATASGRVTAVTLEGAFGEKVIKKDSIRSFFKVNGNILKSTLFDISFNRDSEAETSDLVAASNSSVSYTPTFSSLTINGKGYGHGRGLSQWGARGMADEEGADYADIVSHYYSGVEIKKLY